MTGIIDKKEVGKIDLVGFGIALMAAPVIVSAIILGPLYAIDAFHNSADVEEVISVVGILIAIGVTLYVVIGTPVLIYHLRHHAPEIGRIMALSVFSVLGMLPVGAIISLVTLDPTSLMIAAISTCFALVGGPVLAVVFTVIYKRFTHT